MGMDTQIHDAQRKAAVIQPAGVERWFDVHCPEHPNQVIGVVKNEQDAKFNHGFWCPRCGKHKYFNEKNIKNYLTKKVERYRKNSNLNCSFEGESVKF